MWLERCQIGEARLGSPLPAVMLFWSTCSPGIIRLALVRIAAARLKALSPARREGDCSGISRYALDHFKCASLWAC